MIALNLTMKKIFITTAALAAVAFGAAAAGLQAGPAQPIALPAGSHHPVLSPDGNTLLFSSQDHTGLKALKLSTGEITTIDENASAGFNPVFSTDGSEVFYRTASMEDGLLYRDVRSYSLTDRSGRRLAAPSRDNVNMAGLAGGTYAYADYRTIKVQTGGTAVDVSPLPDSHSYLWASLDSEGTRMLFTEPFEGVFVSNADGSDARRLLAKGDFASWAGNGWIVAVVSHDDGYVILDSTLVAVNVNTGETVSLTSGDILVGEATASESGKVVYTTLDGRMYMISLF